MDAMNTEDLHGKWNFDTGADDANEERRAAIVGEAEARRDEVEYATAAKVNEAKAIADGKAREVEALHDSNARINEANSDAQARVAEARFNWIYPSIRRLTLVAVLLASFYYVPDFWRSLPGAMVTISNNIIQALK